ncbi:MULTISPECIES: F0F1 ATP synthase subunit gamma [unclassified Mesorhizobium]|uniref:F0F1 ATP synthase subunit gamma n=1 Tax=unclassified Mesorhizobium TaxID=325217 RepID=UPI00112B3D01|nr:MULTISPECIES: F0F1 ATP synthase subunit gamma [unclassified Mesorhizobium]TPJ50195.1 F0F1 ATP synthase subunit gamma [Mesorhizobium sp. B2-6-6]MBZ9700292.1 F0F1 ATP synthase subunit gamma [Mesorhizobium sp. CO1-1-3]MBZ9893027.1 F0F1 ATP synthase subunit gamma [Mesorhizobium sp. BR1-1-6]MBZ9920943.1 F0F1 ATP synthase subunit gamma [Mesorhizobium sp. BR1-1-7]MBZ9950071.1 F0F1 ATP synthase subunit gamma [Mesorhizobium sp. BR1-1-11]
MPSLKDLRNRIASVKATQKITKAMQMVAAAKLRRAQEAAEAARPYSERMGSVLANITQAIGGGGDAPALMTGTGKDDVHLLVVCTAERGLCGGFNSQIARLARDHIRRLLADGKQVKIICVGKKGFDILRRDYASMILDRIDLREVKTLGFVNADTIARKVIHLFNEGGFDICTLFYSQFKSVISQVPTAQQIIPAAASSAPAEAADGASAVYEYEPEPGEILSELIPRNIAVQIFRALLENAAGEMGAKMSAMDNATRNAGEMINKLSITYNRQRQAQITKELIEIISGAEAL